MTILDLVVPVTRPKHLPGCSAVRMWPFSRSQSQCLCCGIQVTDSPLSEGEWVVVGERGRDRVVQRWEPALRRPEWKAMRADTAIRPTIPTEEPSDFYSGPLDSPATPSRPIVIRHIRPVRALPRFAEAA